MLRPKAGHGVVVLALALLSMDAEATSICRWVNASGQRQIAQVVPEAYD